MPTYDYKCQKCGHVFEVFHSMSASPKVVCEKCGDSHVSRLIGSGAGLIFKGTGFYQTDYKKASPPAEKKKSDPKKGASDGKTA